MGLLWSCHPDGKAQRYYDAATLERLKQIIILRKMQIPIKDMAAIFVKFQMGTTTKRRIRMKKSQVGYSPLPVPLWKIWMTLFCS